jgi:hypothetical protein
MRRHLAGVAAAPLVVFLLAVLGSVALGPAPRAHAYTIGWNDVASPSESGSWGTGYGPGWVALTFDTGGAPHGPIIGVLYSAGVGGEPGTDHMDVYSTHGPAASVDGPFAGGYAYGGFDGCAWAYWTGKLRADGAHHTPSCTQPPNHTTKIFCYDQGADRLCNDGEVQRSTEPETGVWKDITAHPATVNAGGCDAWGNVGSAAIYNGAPVAWANLLGHVASGTVKVRYVTKDDRAVMALVADGALPAHMRWAFLPRTCLTPAF